MSKPAVIGIVMATRIEAEPFLAAFNLEKAENRHFPLHIDGDIVLAISGIGKANAAIATTYLCLTHHPYRILNLGAAGATNDRCPLGSVYQIEKVTEYDRPHLRLNEPMVHKPDILPGFRNAAIATQDRPVIDAQDREAVSLHAGLVDMEAASVVQASSRFRIPSSLFKFVSDTPDHPGHNLIVEHIEEYRDSFCEYISRSVIPAVRKIYRHT